MVERKGSVHEPLALTEPLIIIQRGISRVGSNITPRFGLEPLIVS